MAAGDTALIVEASLGTKMKMEIWEITTNSQTNVTLYTKLSKVIAAFSQFGEDIGTTAKTLDVTISNSPTTRSSVAVASNAASTEKTAYVLILGNV